MPINDMVALSLVFPLSCNYRIHMNESANTVKPRFILVKIQGEFLVAKKFISALVECYRARNTAVLTVLQQLHLRCRSANGNTFSQEKRTMAGGAFWRLPYTRIQRFRARGALRARTDASQRHAHARGVRPRFDTRFSRARSRPRQRRRARRTTRGHLWLLRRPDTATPVVG